MNAVWAKVRSDLRSSLGASVAIVLVIGLAGGLALGAAAAGRRTQTAFPRFLATSNAADLLVAPTLPGLDFDRAVARLPGVTASGLIGGVTLAGPVKPGEPPPDPAFGVNASLDGHFLYTIERPRVVAGRLPRPDRPNEVLLNPDAARALHASIGRRIPMVTLTSVPDGYPNTPVGPSNFTYLTMTVAGIGLGQSDVLPSNFLDTQPEIDLTPAFYRTYATPPGVLAYDGVNLRLQPGTDRPRFGRQIDALARKMGVGPAFIDDSALHEAHVRRALFPQVIAMWLFAGLVGAGLVLVIGLILSRRLFSGAVEHPILRALGMTRGQLTSASLISVAVLASAGCVVAVAVAAATSVWTPFGAAHAAEPHPGFAANLAILGAGFVVLLAVIVAVAAIPAWRAASVGGGALGLAELGGADRPSGLAERATRSGLSPSAGAGIRMALEPGRGRTAVPVRSGTIGLAIALATLIAAVTFGANLTHLVATPRLYGWNWDAMLGSPFGFSSPPVDFLRAVPGVASVAGGDLGHVTIAGVQVPAVGIDPTAGIAPTMIQGRAPAHDDEIVLGAKDLRRFHRSVGDTVPVRVGEKTTPMRVVGEAVFPALAQGSFPGTGLGEGALLTAAGLSGAAVDLSGSQPYNFALIRYAPDADPRAVRAAIAAAAKRERGCHPANQDPPCLVLPARLPADIASFGGIRATPYLLAAILAALAFALMTYTLLTSVRRRRRDLAVLKTIGFLRRQISATVAWQATTIAALAGLIGLPLGVVAGRLAWSVFASDLGVPTSPVLPWLLLLLAVPLGILAANLVAWVPARIAARTPAAVVLRSE